MDYLENLVGCSKALEVVREIEDNGIGSDLHIWKPTMNGNFSVASAWDKTRDRGDELPWRD